MVWNLVAVLVMGVGLGGLAFAARKFTGNKLPKWLIPACAAAGMLGYLAYYDYGWYEFKLSQLPQDTIVIAEKRQTSLLKPWSYLYAPVNSFVVLDGKHKDIKQDQQWLVEYLEYSFDKDPIERLQTQAFVLNCSTLERVPFDQKKRTLAGKVEKITQHDPIYKIACR